MSKKLDIRAATGDDWPAIWSFLREIVRAGETYTWRRDTGENDAREQWLRPPPWRTYVAVDNPGNVVGTATVGPNQDGPGGHVANAGFMVDPAHAGGGVGRALGTFVIEAARAEGYTAMQFNAVVETNTRAVRLWQSLGFDILATVPEAFDHPSEGLSACTSCIVRSDSPSSCEVARGLTVNESRLRLEHLTAGRFNGVE